MKKEEAVQEIKKLVFKSLVGIEEDDCLTSDEIKKIVDDEVEFIKTKGEIAIVDRLLFE